jgi:septum formation protein
LIILQRSVAADQGLWSVLESKIMKVPPLLLASNSPRRHQLLELAGWEFKVQPANIDETRRENEEPVFYVERLAETKARVVAGQAPTGWLVIAADTIVVDDSAEKVKVLEKPATPTEAFEMLSHLRGKTHKVYTALAVLDPGENRLCTDLCITEVPMRLYTGVEISNYIASGDPMDKAGAYAIQNQQFHPVDHLEGCYASVMGLPLCHLSRTLHKFGPLPEMNLSQRCKSALHYNCSISKKILLEEI